jgi:hypothetical protein
MEEKDAQVFDLEAHKRAGNADMFAAPSGYEDPGDDELDGK